MTYEEAMSALNDAIYDAVRAANARAEAAEAKLAETEAVLQGIINLGGTMGSALYAETVDRAARQALATLRGEGETNE